MSWKETGICVNVSVCLFARVCKKFRTDFNDFFVEMERGDYDPYPGFHRVDTGLDVGGTTRE